MAIEIPDLVIMINEFKEEQREKEKTLNDSMKKKIDRWLFVWVILGCLSLTALVYARGETTENRVYSFQKDIQTLSSNVAALTATLSTYEIIK